MNLSNPLTELKENMPTAKSLSFIIQFAMYVCYFSIVYLQLFVFINFDSIWMFCVLKCSMDSVVYWYCDGSVVKHHHETKLLLHAHCLIDCCTTPKNKVYSFFSYVFLYKQDCSWAKTCFPNLNCSSLSYEIHVISLFIWLTLICIWYILNIT